MGRSRGFIYAVSLPALPGGQNRALAAGLEGFVGTDKREMPGTVVCWVGIATPGAGARVAAYGRRRHYRSRIVQIRGRTRLGWGCPPVVAGSGRPGMALALKQRPQVSGNTCPQSFGAVLFDGPGIFSGRRWRRGTGRCRAASCNYHSGI